MSSGLCDPRAFAAQWHVGVQLSSNKRCVKGEKLPAAHAPLRGYPSAASRTSPHYMSALSIGPPDNAFANLKWLDSDDAESLFRGKTLHRLLYEFVYVLFEFVGEFHGVSNLL